MLDQVHHRHHRAAEGSGVQPLGRKLGTIGGNGTPGVRDSQNLLRTSGHHLLGYENGDHIRHLPYAVAHYQQRLP